MKMDGPIPKAVEVNKGDKGEPVVKKNPNRAARHAAFEKQVGHKVGVPKGKHAKKGEHEKK